MGICFRLGNFIYNFIIAFYGLTQDEIKKVGKDIARAQFFRSEYADKRDKPDYGFLDSYPHLYDGRAGLFEIEPFKSHTNIFNVFYVTAPLANGPQQVEQFDSYCSSIMQSDRKQLIVLRRASTSPPDFNTWKLEGLATAFNHEIGHVFGLKDEYYTTMDSNNLTADEIEDWNQRIPNCDYGRPFTNADYQSGNGYCKKWCCGVDSAKYQTYRQYVNAFGACRDMLHAKADKNAWDDYCRTTLQFQRFKSDERQYPGTIVGGNPSRPQTIEQSCDAIYDDSPQNSYYEESIYEYCFSGTLYNIWDLDIGNGCLEGTGCYFGCGGFPRSSYGYDIKIGAFADVFRPNANAIMGGGPVDNSGPGFTERSHENDKELPSYGRYDIDQIMDRWRQLKLMSTHVGKKPSSHCPSPLQLPPVPLETPIKIPQPPPIEEPHPAR